MERLALLVVLAVSVTSQPSYPPPYSPECYVLSNGNDYRGMQDHTFSGIPCQAWASQSPHTHTITANLYPDSGLDGNYCRNPDNSNFVWCYTTDPNVRWQTCALAPPQQYCTPSPCNPVTTCNNQGFCLSDQSCSCYPQFYGTYCDKPITSNGLSDGGLAGVIVGWLLAVPVLACLGFIFYQMHQSGYFDGCYDGARDCCANCCQRCQRRKQANLGEAVEMRIGSPQPAGDSKRSEKPPVPKETAGGSAADSSAAEPAKPSVPDPPDADVLVQQVVDIMQGNVTQDKARKALRDNGWAMETALTQLLA